MHKLLSVMTISVIATMPQEHVTVNSMQAAKSICYNKTIKTAKDMQEKKSFRIAVMPNEIPEEIRDYVENTNVFMRFRFINTTDSMISIRTQDGQIIMIQEALDKDGKWKPIEYWVNSDCGNSYMMPPLIIKSGEYITGGIIRYKGNFNTKLRLKFKNKQTFYSNVFEGSIHPDQFLKPQFKGQIASLINYLQD